MRFPLCVACGALNDLHHHHLVPRSAGGSDDDDNLLTLCQRCHDKAHGWDRINIRVLQREGIERAKAAGVYKGAKRRIDGAQVRALHADGFTPTAIAAKLGIGRASVYRLAKPSDTD